MQRSKEFNLIFNNSKNKSRIASHLSTMIIKNFITVADQISEEKYVSLVQKYLLVTYD